jgi:hypothetical protein
MCGAVLTISVFIRNPNPIPVIINTLTTTEGLNVSIFWSEAWADVKEHKNMIPPFASRQVNLRITFKQSLKARTDRITISAGNILSWIMIGWTGYSGKITATSNFSVIFPNVPCTGTLFLESTYPLSLRVYNVSSLHDFIKVERISSLLRGNGVSKAVAKVSLIFSDQMNIWKRVSKVPSPVDIGFEIHFKNHLTLLTIVSAQIGVLNFSDIELSLGYVFAHTIIVKTVTIENVHSCTIAFHGEAFDIVIQPHHSLSVDIPIEIGEPGYFNFSYPITTNLTAPFFLKVTGKSVLPRVRLRNAEGMTVTELQFTNNVWSSVVFLSNDGMATLNLSKFDFTEKLFNLRSNCSQFLEPQTSCALNFSVNLRDIQNQSKVLIG